MNADLLRLILFIAGIALVLGIYFWERHKRANATLHAVRREQEEQEPIAFNEVEDEPLSEPEVEPPLETETEPEPEFAAQAEVETNPVASFVMPTEPETLEAGLEQELGQLDALVTEEKDSQLRGEQLPFSFTAEEPEEPTVADVAASKIVQIHIKARNGAFAGEDILQAAQAMGLAPGEMDVFHRMGPLVPGGREKSLYSMASLVEPGSFPMDAMEGFSSPGLVLFLMLPTAGDDLELFNDMLSVAEGLATRLGGILQDETHSVLTRQTIIHLREEIIELKRQQQIAQKKS